METGGIPKQGDRGTYIVTVDIFVNVDEFERKVGELERKVRESSFGAVKCNRHHKHKVLSVGTNLRGRYQTKA